MEKEKNIKVTDSVSAVQKNAEIKLREYLGEMFVKEVDELPTAFKEFSGMLQSYCAWRSLYKDLTK